MWWRCLSGLAVFNLLLWGALAWTTAGADGFWSSPYAPWQVLCSGIFTAVCAFRSFFPRIDLERYCLVDSFMSSMVLGRSAATVAEVSFAVQVALVMHELGGVLALHWLQLTAVPIVVLLTTAQVFCWASVLTRSHIWHAIEESLWAFTFAMVVVCFAIVTMETTGHWLWVTRAGIVLGGFYVLFMVTVDVPMYVRRWRWRSSEFGAETLSLSEGWKDALHHRVPTRSWKIWKPEVAWLTGYFSVAVWISMTLVWLPR